MCGVVGIAGSLYLKEKRALRDLIIFDSVRGFDSTGLLQVNLDFEPTTFKKLGDGINFLDYAKADSLIESSSKVLAAHNRWATRGKVTQTNAHPFTYGDITGMHNGTLKDQTLLPDHQHFKVDSENVVWALDKIGVDATIKKLHGAYALVWYDEAEQAINLIRNEERPLSYCYSEDGKSLFWASEWLMLELALTRNGVKHTDIVSLPIHTLMTVKLPKSGKKIEHVTQRKVEHYVPCLRPSSKNVSHISAASPELTKIFRTEHEFQIGELVETANNQRYFTLLPIKDIEVEGKDLAVRIYVGSFSDTLANITDAKKKGMYVRARLSSYADRLRNPTYITVGHSSLKFINENELTAEVDEVLYAGFDGTMHTEAQWKEATKGGCQWCGSDAHKDDDNVWVAPDEFFCPDCCELKTVKEFIN